MAKINFGGVWENVVTHAEFPLEKARNILKNEIIAVIGYGIQGPAQSQNLRDNGFKVIIGQRKPSPEFAFDKCWEKAMADGWKEGENLFEIEEAAKRGTIILYLVSDAGQIATWPIIKKHLSPGKALYFSHGFGIVFSKYTDIVPPKDVDVIMVAPKGAGRTVRKYFLEGKGINASFAIWQDATGKAKERVLSLGIGIGCGYLFETTFEKEVYSDLTGERGVLMGALAGIMEAQYELLRKMGHSPSEAFNETVEEATQSLIPLIGEHGMDWMYANCSQTAQRGALDWKDRFKKAVEPVFNELYQRVVSGEEAKRVIEASNQPNYPEKLAEELRQMRESEMWQAGAKVRELRPERQKK
ncbi:MAG: ketol-acid reductoisomerase [Patescibacteria group bacterium]|nr:ketol-acid reductoisomerase [Patescibacteria group bacterium]